MDETDSSEARRWQYTRLCAAMGNLFFCWGRLEGSLATSLRLHLTANLKSSVGDKEGVRIASAIYGSARFKTSRDLIKRIMSVEDAPKETVDALAGIFAQIGHIEDLRDKIAHQFMLPDDITGQSDLWLITDMTTSKDLQKSTVYTIDVLSIQLAGKDLGRASTLLGQQVAGRKLYQESIPLAPVPWLYKQEMLKTERRKILTSFQEHLHQHQASGK